MTTPFLWDEISEDRHVLLSSLAIERRSDGRWYPVQLDEQGTAWRLGRQTFDNDGARAFIEELAAERDPNNLLMEVSPGITPRALGAAFLISMAAAFVLASLPLPLFWTAPMIVVSTFLITFTAWTLSTGMEDDDA